MDDDFVEMLSEWLEVEHRIQEQRVINYPSDVPNASGHHAFIRGISIENSFRPFISEYNFLFETALEKVYVWTHTENKYSALVSDVDISVKSKPFWKTIGSMIYLSQLYYRAFEGAAFEGEFEYKIMYYFSPNSSLESIEFFNLNDTDRLFLLDGGNVKVTDIADLAPMIELMYRDDRCYIATSLLLSSFQLCYCCLICELGLYQGRKHETHDYELWEQANYVTKMESALVQACRCAESILGKPARSKKKSRVVTHKQRWVDATGINPDDVFIKSRTSYWDYYPKMFDELRNPSAHSQGKVQIDLKRRHIIEAQCFAALILRGYIRKNEKSFEDALDILNFNKVLLSRVAEKMSTILTSPNELS